MPSVVLYRTVSEAEYADLRRLRRFRPGRGAEGKYFWETYAAADTFGEQTAGHYHPDGYRVVGARVPEGVASAFHRWPRMDGIGPAHFAPADALIDCTVLFRPPR